MKRRNPARFVGSLPDAERITHYIYHIPGRKFGCTTNYESRRVNYGSDVRKVMHVHEVCVGCTDQEAGDRERYWNLLFGYKPGPHYGAAADSYRKGGQKSAELGVGGFQTMPTERHSEIGRRNFELGIGIHKLTSAEKADAARKAIIVQAANGTGFYGMTKEQRREIALRTAAQGKSGFQLSTREQQIARAQRGGKKASELRLGIHAMTPEQRRAASRKGDKSKGGKRSAELYRNMECPHCGVVGNAPNVFRFHFDRCKHKPVAGDAPCAAQ